jgi:UbiD family decarboxylase
MEQSMARGGVETASKSKMQYRGLRGWLEQVDKMGELRKVDGAHWDVEMGAITHMLTEKSRGTAPAILFDNVPGYPKGYRTLYGQLSSARRIALTLGLPLDFERKVDVVQTYHARMQDLKPLPPRFVNDGPIFENVMEGDAIDVLKFPVPRHHEMDKSRFIGTADCVMTQDPDSGWFNLGAYRSQVYDGKTVGCQITEGKHGPRSARWTSPAACAASRSTWCVGPIPAFRSRPIARSRSRARRCPARPSRKGRSANGWATTLTIRKSDLT